LGVFYFNQLKKQAPDSASAIPSIESSNDSESLNGVTKSAKNIHSDSAKTTIFLLFIFSKYSIFD